MNKTIRILCNPCIGLNPLLVLLIALLFPSLSIVAGSAKQHNYYFTAIGGESGLSQNDVKCILQDSWRFMWFGSRNKLNRYDGKSIKVFDCNDPVSGRKNNNINALYEDKERKLWIGTDNGIFILDPYSEKISFFSLTTAEGKNISNWVADIQADDFDNIWIVVPGQGLFRYHTLDEKLYLYQFQDNQLPHQGKPQSMCVENNGRIWVGTNGSGVYSYNRTADTFTQLLGNQNGSSLSGEHIYTLCDYGDELVLGIHEGKLKKLNKLKNTLVEVNVPEVHYKIIRHVVCYDDELWIGTEDGVYIINEWKKTVVHLKEDRMSKASLSDNMVEKIYRDREGGIWVSTYFGGVNYLPQRGMVFERFVPLSDPNSISSTRIRELVEDPYGRIWIGTEDDGVNVFDPSTNTFKRMRKSGQSEAGRKKCLGLALVNNQIWAGFFKKGLDIFQLPDMQSTHYSGEQLNLSESSIMAVHEDRFGRVWMGNVWGVFVADKNQIEAGNMHFKQVEAFGTIYVYDIFEDSDGFIWVATMGTGAFCYNPNDDKARRFTHNSEDSNSISSNSVSSVMEDTKGHIWFSTDRGGICKYDKIADRFTTISVKDGLPDDVTYKIIEDKQHNFWFGTNKGLVKFDPQTGKVRVFTKNDGLPGDQFNYQSALATTSGKLYFGGLDGLIAFNPVELKENSFVPPVYITKVTIYNKDIETLSLDSPLKKSIIHTDKLKLKYNQSNIGFDFVALSYAASTANQYAYQMVGVDKDWIYTTDNQSASYAKLDPGNYVFKVKASNNDGLWNEEGASIEIEILPPWWLSGIAYIVYIIVLVCLAYYWICWYRRRNEKRNREKLRLFEIEKEKELYSSKLDFFTNIAHEVRTPITLINGPLESMLEMDITEPEIKKNLLIMGKNTSRLLNLINQLLDFRKVDSNKLNMTFSMLNISAFLKNTMMQFEPTVARKNKKLRLHSLEEDIFAPVDKIEFVKIMNNLLSNAVKYSEKEIDVILSKEDDCFVVRVQSDGELIPSGLREKVFEPFYQLRKDEDMPSGSGIGLSLVRSLAELHNGTVHLETQSGRNDFVLKLPLTQKNVVEVPEESVISETFVIDNLEWKQDKCNFEVVLVVEDNAEMRSFIADRLRDVFIVETASSGTEAMTILSETNVDIIVSDVMMPGMDGFEFCRQLKLNVEYSHIPIVLLTAKNDLASKIQGLETGAEAYIEKPFSFHFLISQLTTLLNNRRREREAFMQKPFIPTQQMGLSKSDEKFMEKVMELISKNITDSSFNIESIADSMFMSRSSLNRKIKALSGLTPTDFIRLIRLKKAAEIIQQGESRIGKVCYQVGINSPSYFIRLFHKQFGMTPKEFEKEQTDIRIHRRS